jgi:hypothetical protein
MNMLSLYDYLGYAAGEKLGKEVWDAAANADVKTEVREISNPKYTGKVMLYPENFLKEYFQNQQQAKLVLSSSDEDDDLPF